MLISSFIFDHLKYLDKPCPLFKSQFPKVSFYINVTFNISSSMIVIPASLSFVAEGDKKSLSYDVLKKTERASDFHFLIFL